MSPLLQNYAAELRETARTFRTASANAKSPEGQNNFYREALKRDAIADEISRVLNKLAVADLAA